MNMLSKTVERQVPNSEIVVYVVEFIIYTRQMRETQF